MTPTLFRGKIEMMNKNTDRKLEGVERLLREQGSQGFGPEFRRNVMDAIAVLPDPELLPPPAAQRDWRWFLSLIGPFERTGMALTLALILLALLPQSQVWLAAMSWEWGDLMVSLNVGDAVLSASIGTMLAAGLGALLMAGVGIYSSRNHLIGT
jgi:hypothetical protein